MTRFVLSGVCCWLLAAVLVIPAAAADPVAAEALQILQTNCNQCHTKAMSMSGLDLSSRESFLRGGSRGPGAVPGKASESKLIEAVERRGKLAMPPTKALSEAEVATLRRWVDEGAAWTEAPAAAGKTQSLTAWWSFQKVIRPAVPRSGDAWAGNEIDEFILQKLKPESLRPGARANPSTLVRRAYMDLWGLPPILEQVREFTSDKSPDAWPKLIDQVTGVTSLWREVGPALAGSGSLFGHGRVRTGQLYS